MGCDIRDLGFEGNRYKLDGMHGIGRSIFVVALGLEREVASGLVYF